MKVSAVLLAGGESRRFGRDKALFPWSGEPLWKHQLAILRATCPGEIVLSARSDPGWRPRDIIFASDAQPPCGPIGGLSAALGAMKGSHLLALAIDMPLMTSDYLRSLMGRIIPGCGIVPILKGEPEPLAAIYPVEATTIIQSILAEQTNLALRHLVEKLLSAGIIKGLPVSPEETILFQNANHPFEMPGSTKEARGL